ncbi:hypothetical protein CPB83DRAFT_887034 [Crepidotus variabilis]|uniref:Uncharacterized protein n=1 Tax=Crepidotus variabilis TaxID=179855 RepID=A0A9P6E624_9AGAR|nr:hypothetical protein CPB83DRAFT_887034 [Crepidotus variabilis]
MSTLSYLGNVNDAIRIVEKLYPQAALYEVDGVASDGKPTGDATKINKLRVVFRAGEGTVIINTTSSWGEWSVPTYIPEPWLEDVVIPWPIKMDIVEAAKIMDADKKAFVEFSSVTLRWPLYPGTEEPYYIFNSKGHYVFVGVYSHKVSFEDLTEKKAGATEK